MVDYKDDPVIRELFAGAIYITQHMSAKDRNEYSQFRKTKYDKKGVQGPIVPPPPVPAMNYQMGYGMQQPPPPFMAPMGRQPNNYGPPNQFYPM